MIEKVVVLSMKVVIISYLDYLRKVILSSIRSLNAFLSSLSCSKTTLPRVFLVLLSLNRYKMISINL